MESFLIALSLDETDFHWKKKQLSRAMLNWRLWQAIGLYPGCTACFMSPCLAIAQCYRQHCMDCPVICLQST